MKQLVGTEFECVIFPVYRKPLSVIIFFLNNIISVFI